MRKAQVYHYHECNAKDVRDYVRIEVTAFMTSNQYPNV